jgi:hypothetical protein
LSQEKTAGIDSGGFDLHRNFAVAQSRFLLTSLGRRSSGAVLLNRIAFIETPS